MIFISAYLVTVSVMRWASFFHYSHTPVLLMLFPSALLIGYSKPGKG